MVPKTIDCGFLLRLENYAELNSSGSGSGRPGSRCMACQYLLFLCCWAAQVWCHPDAWIIRIKKIPEFSSRLFRNLQKAVIIGTVHLQLIRNWHTTYIIKTMVSTSVVMDLWVTKVASEKTRGGNKYEQGSKQNIEPCLVLSSLLVCCQSQDL